MFDTYTSLIMLITVVGVAWALFRNQDTLHPLIFLMPVSAYMYGVRPLISDPVTLRSYFTLSELSLVQGINAAGVAALGLGCIVGSRGLRRDSTRMSLHAYTSDPRWRRRLRSMGLGLGIVAVLLYAYGLFNVGGFVEAYDSVKGGGRAASGYLRDFTLLSVPAVLLVFLGTRSPISWKDRIYITLFNTPLLLHGLLSARRGPTFIGIATLGIGWYYTRGKRPSIFSLGVAGGAVGLLLITLLTFRSEIYLGSSFLLGQGPGIEEVISQSVEKQSETSAGSEFVYGTYVLLQAHEEGDHYWGTRYLTYVFVRPIPGFIWPTKYQDVGMQSLLVNAGTLGQNADPEADMLREVPPGAAPGFVADLYVEFGYGAIVAAFLFGWLYGVLWRRALVRGGIWGIVYATSLVLSLYFVSQTVEAILFRFLVICVPTVFLWQYQARRYAPWAKMKATPTSVRLPSS